MNDTYWIPLGYLNEKRDSIAASVTRLENLTGYPEAMLREMQYIRLLAQAIELECEKWIDATETYISAKASQE